MKKKLTLIFAMSILLSSCGGSMVKVNQGEIAKNKAELEAKNQKREIEGLEEDKSDEKKSKKDKNKKKIKKTLNLLETIIQIPKETMIPTITRG